jgi:hypothetical protein
MRLFEQLLQIISSIMHIFYLSGRLTHVVDVGIIYTVAFHDPIFLLFYICRENKVYVHVLAPAYRIKS